MITLTYKASKDVWWKGHLLIVQYSFEKWTGSTTSSSIFHQNDTKILNQKIEHDGLIVSKHHIWCFKIWFLKMLFEESKHDICDNICCCMVKLLHDKLFVYKNAWKKLRICGDNCISEKRTSKIKQINSILLSLGHPHFIQNTISTLLLNNYVHFFMKGVRGL